MTEAIDLERKLLDIARHVCPIFKQDERGIPWLVGTGTLLKLEHYHFLITASHVIDEFSVSKPMYIGGNTALLRLTQPSVRYGDDKSNEKVIDADIGVIYIPPVIAADVSLRYAFTTIREWGDPTQYHKLTLYALLGYPANKNGLKYGRNPQIQIKSHYYVMRNFLDLSLLSSENAFGKRADVHFVLDAPRKKSTNLKFERLKMPEPHGVSGGGVWMISLDPTTGMASQPILVGIGIETLTQPDCFVITRIQLCHRLLSDLLKEIGLVQ